MPPPGELVTKRFDHDGGRRVSVWVPSQPYDAVVVAADGHWHMSRLVDALAGARRPPTILVGVDGAQHDRGRLTEYVEGVDPDRFAAHERFFVEEVRGLLQSDVSVTMPPERTAVWGASLGAELALAMAMRHPDIYGIALAASPGAGYRPSAPVPASPRVYLLAGAEVPFFLENARRWATALSGAGADVVMRERHGEHGGAFWFDELPAMLTWAFGAAPQEIEPDNRP